MSNTDPLGNHRKAREYEALLCEELEGGIKNACSALNSTSCARRHISCRTFGITPKGSSDVRRVIRRALRSPATLSPTTPHRTSRQISSGQLPSTAWQRHRHREVSLGQHLRSLHLRSLKPSVQSTLKRQQSSKLRASHSSSSLRAPSKMLRLRSSASITKRHSSSARGRSSSGLPLWHRVPQRIHVNISLSSPQR